MVSEVTRLLSAVAEGDAQAADQLIPLVYDELRRIALATMARESPDHTLQATALVHEAYLRLVGGAGAPCRHRRQFFAVAAETMRRILVDHARRKSRRKRGGKSARRPLEEFDLVAPERAQEILDIHQALEELEAAHEPAALVVKLRYFAGFTNREAADMLGISPRKADQLWAYARVWLLDRLAGEAATPFDP
jgi:RNA polymerase sigma factor (TIGR02999 family)